MHRQISISWVFFGLLIFCAYGEEILIQIVVKKPINIVSDRYVSFAVEPSNLLELCSTPSNIENATILTQQIGSAYLKIAGSTTNSFTLDDESIPSVANQVRITQSDWLALHKWINSTNLKPVIALPYSSQSWSHRNIISILGISSRLGIKNCLWQLGSELNTTDSINYVDDMGTFKTIIDAFRKNDNNWGVVGADIASGSKPDDVDLYAELSKHISEANGWTQSIEYNSLESDDNIFFEKDPALRNLLRSKVSVWLNVPSSYQLDTSELCGEKCEYNGLRWAKTLGTSAQTGFNVVFKKIEKSDFINPSLSYYVSVLHKKIMGQKVFDTKVLNADALSPQYFTHCTKNMSGSFAVMGVNFADFRTKISTKLPIKYTGLEMYQYILNVDHGHVLLNGAPVNVRSNMDPLAKIRRNSRPTTFTLPPRSVGFWVFPLANLRQCALESNTEHTPSEIVKESDISPRTASENLLHELITEIVQIDNLRNPSSRPKRHAIVKKDSKHMNRIKRNADPGYKSRRDVNLFKQFNDEVFTRQKIGLSGIPRRRVQRQINNNINLNKLFKTFELPQAKKFKMNNFWNLPPVVYNTIGQNPSVPSVPSVTSTVHDVYRVDPKEQIFKSVENPELPTGDVFFEVGEELKSVDYVAFDDGKTESSGKIHHPNKQRMNEQKYVDFDVEDVDAPGADHMYEFQADDMRGHRNSDIEISPYSELWESDVYQKAPPPEQIERDIIGRSEENPNQQEQNIDLIVKQLPPTWRQNQENLMKAKDTLSTIYVDDRDRISTYNMNLQTRHSDMDDDGFFVSRRKRRSIGTNFNDEIEHKLNHMNKLDDHHAAEEDYGEFINKNESKLSLLEKVTKIIESLEKMDDIGKYSNIEKLTADIKELENFLFRGNSKLKVFKPKNRSGQRDIRKKCKILSLNLEQQCLKENDFHPKRIIKRDAKYNNEQKSKKITSLKKVFAKDKTDKLNRVRRNTVWESSSWEADDRNNMIIKELYTANEARSNDVVPSVSFRKPIYVDYVDYQPNEGKKSFTEQISVLENLQQTDSPSIVSEITEQQTVPTFTVDTNILDGQLIEKDIDENQQNQEEMKHRTPRFMKKISKSVDNFMNIVEKHVSGWWNLLS